MHQHPDPARHAAQSPQSRAWSYKTSSQTRTQNSHKKVEWNECIWLALPLSTKKHSRTNHLECNCTVKCHQSLKTLKCKNLVISLTSSSTTNHSWHVAHPEPCEPRQRGGQRPAVSSHFPKVSCHSVWPGDLEKLVKESLGECGFCVQRLRRIFHQESFVVDSPTFSSCSGGWTSAWAQWQEALGWFFRVQDMSRRWQHWVYTHNAQCRIMYFSSCAPYVCKSLGILLVVHPYQAWRTDCWTSCSVGATRKQVGRSFSRMDVPKHCAKTPWPSLYFVNRHARHTYTAIYNIL